MGLSPRPDGRGDRWGEHLALRDTARAFFEKYAVRTAPSSASEGNAQ